MVIRWLRPYSKQGNRELSGDALFNILWPPNETDSVPAELLRGGESSTIPNQVEYPIGVVFSRSDIVRSFTRDVYSKTGEDGRRVPSSHKSRRMGNSDLREVWIRVGSKAKAIVVYDKPTKGVYDLVDYLRVPIEVVENFSETP
jgi:hypothetical protein